MAAFSSSCSIHSKRKFSSFDIFHMQSVLIYGNGWIKKKIDRNMYLCNLFGEIYWINIWIECWGAKDVYIKFDSKGFFCLLLLFSCFWWLDKYIANYIMESESGTLNSYEF